MKKTIFIIGALYIFCACPYILSAQKFDRSVKTIENFEGSRGSILLVGKGINGYSYERI